MNWWVRQALTRAPMTQITLTVGQRLVCPTCGRGHVVTRRQAQTSKARPGLKILCDGTFPNRHPPAAAAHDHEYPLAP